MTRQGMERQRLVRKGKCVRCRRIKEEVTGCMCEPCRDKVRHENRNRYRMKNGIPIDAPVLGRRPTIEEEMGR